MSLSVVSSGQSSLLVDFGRLSARSFGVPVGGSADRAGLALGNALVGNTPEALGLEFAFVGPTLRAEDPTFAVVFGAPFDLEVSGNPVAAGRTFRLNRGDELRIGGTVAGARGYLCVAGGFDSGVVLGSRSAMEPIRIGDWLRCQPSDSDIRRSLPFVALDDPGVGALRAVDGPQANWFPDGQFFDREFRVSPASDRMGLRLSGETVSRRPGELPSEAVAPGAVQITNDGLPVVLGVDGQTVGGYPKIAHVIRADLDRLAQLRPGDTVRFRRVTWKEAELLALERSARLREWLCRLRESA